jgi:outer membrane protein OmpA-like peptidoglycan-associated protein
VVAEKMTEAEAAKEANKQKAADEVSKLNKTSTKESDEVSKPVKAVKSKSTKKSLVNDDEGSSSEEGKDKAPALVTGSLLNVPFFENSISLSKKAKEDLIKSIPNISDSARIVVRGRPSVKGDENIAGTRALVIKNFLVDNGVDESVIETTQDANVKAGKNHGFYVSELILLSGEKSKKAQAAKKAADTSLNIKAGDLISKQLSAWAKRGYDYNLQWEASEYRATAPLALNTGFNDTLDAVAGAMKINGVDLDVTIYDNKVIRVVEMKK